MAAYQAFLEIVPRTGVEPVISALKGRRPWPLDERGVRAGCLYTGLLIVLYGPVICQATFCERFERFSEHQTGYRTDKI